VYSSSGNEAIYFTATPTSAVIDTSGLITKLGIATNSKKDVEIGGKVKLVGQTTDIANATIGNAHIQVSDGATTILGLDPNEIYFSGADGTVGTLGNFKLNLNTNGAVRATIDGTGNMGIGTASPSQKLHVAGNIMIGAGNGIYSAYNSNFILNDHNNGNVTLSGAGALLTIGYQNTTKVVLNQDLYGSNGTTMIANKTGTLYYTGVDTDTRYAKLTAVQTITGATTISGNGTAEAISVKGGTANQVFLGLYADSSAQTTRSAWLGFGSAGTLDLTMKNERTNGNLALNTTGTGAVVTSGTLNLNINTTSRLVLPVGTDKWAT
jgi:hypothetical protein